MQNKSKNNAPRHFNLTARILHWLMAVAILAMLFIGVGMTTSITWRPWLIDIHRPLGIAILLLVIIRLINRLYFPIPPLPPTVPRWQAFMAHASHWLLYLLMFSLPLLGWATLSAGNWPVTLFPGWDLPPIAPTNSTLYAWFRTLHGILAWLLFAVVIGHLSAALLHAWIYRDGVFSSMALGSSEPSSKGSSAEKENVD
ncbi:MULTISPECIES: cytochrome b [Acinetobacter]|uniref:cytochrome b n=1 Tax=Acinetobacter TaxID=469 RepID=UPI00136D7EAA|nr:MULTISPECIES: cytochrome b/b6 domain-containing protein [Acinetobacter]MDS7958854.1 cytochrome b/b6 domain-containing protein [Acinetobacter sp. V104_13]MDS7982983.1 cytochrome b/b6 domain-containing protein [Acinetobacter sp. V104_3]MZY04840.1 cytochrome b [Acinetobacter pittii]